MTTLAELAHGAARATSLEMRNFRQSFIRELRTGIPTLPVTAEVAMRAGDIDGTSRCQGITIGFSDLLIGATALEFEHSVVTANIRHFNLIPGLTVTPY